MSSSSRNTVVVWKLLLCALVSCCCLLVDEVESVCDSEGNCKNGVECTKAFLHATGTTDATCNFSPSCLPKNFTTACQTWHNYIACYKKNSCVDCKDYLLTKEMCSAQSKNVCTAAQCDGAARNYSKIFSAIMVVLLLSCCIGCMICLILRTIRKFYPRASGSNNSKSRNSRRIKEMELEDDEDDDDEETKMVKSSVHLKRMEQAGLLDSDELNERD